MLKRFYSLAGGIILGTVLTLGTLFSCHQIGSQDTAATQMSSTVLASEGVPDTSMPPAAAISPGELRTILADMANAHKDKTKLSWWVTTPLRPVDAPFRPFFDNMGKQNKELLGELQSWAKQHQVDLTYKQSTDFEGRSQAIMDARQEKLVRNDDKSDFQHDILVQMYTDYENRISEIEALQPSVKDPGLKAYLDKSHKMYSEGSEEILSLLHRYQFH